MDEKEVRKEARGAVRGHRHNGVHTTVTDIITREECDAMEGKEYWT